MGRSSLLAPLLQSGLEVVAASREGLTKAFAQVEVSGWGVCLLGCCGFDVKDVGGDTVLGGDAGEGDIETAVGDILGYEMQ